MLNFVICDDKQQCIDSIKYKLEKIIDNEKMLAKIDFLSTEPHKVLRYAIAHAGNWNAYLLGINFSGRENGISLAKRIREYDKNAFFVFLTGYTEYSIECYKTKAFDFLVKPISLDTLSETIKRLYKEYLDLADTRKKFITVKSGPLVYRINIFDIIYFEKFGQVMVVHTVNGRIRCYKSLDSVEKELDGENFFRCHKSYLVNLDHVKCFDIKCNHLIMSSNDKCLVSRNYKKKLLLKLREGGTAERKLKKDSYDRDM